MEFEHIWDFMPVHIICKLHKDPIKNWKIYAPDKFKHEQPHDKTNKVTVHPAKTQPSLIRVFAVRLMGS